MDSNFPQFNNNKGFYAVSPKYDCPHESCINFEKVSAALNKALIESPCSQCDVTAENWLCLECLSTGCSRYHNSHMAKHNQDTGHKIALSFSDGSVWCYTCDSYISSKELAALAIKFSLVKFPDSEDVSSLVKHLDKLKVEDKPKVEFTREMLIEGLKNKKFKKIVMMTGAGISVSAGIPDFRTPGTGLYSSLASYNLKNPEQIFDIKFFRSTPEPFYKIAKTLFTTKVSPVISHKFIKLLADEEQLYLSFTQNIDGLEVAAGVDPKYLVEAHGHFREIHCLSCRKEGLMEEFMKHLEDQIIYKCQCEGLYKPDVVFFGEALPHRFLEDAEKVEDADLVIVMGTSLKVFPFAGLVLDVPPTTPLVYINRENTQIKRDNFLFMEGEIDPQVDQLIKDLGWEDKLKQLDNQKAI